MAFLLALGSVLLVSIVSLLGAVSLTIREDVLNRSIRYLVSFAAGALLGDSLLHLLPEAAENGFTLTVALLVLAGILTSFVIERFVHWHHCHHTGEHAHPTGYVNLFGDAVHNFVDGIIIGASYLVSVPVGMATTLAVILHEIPQELGDFAVLIHSKFTVRRALFFNFLTACTAVLGAIVVFAAQGVDGIATALVPFAAGSFLYVSLADLVPELHKEPRSGVAVAQLLCFFGGIGLLALLLLLE